MYRKIVLFTLIPTITLLALCFFLVPDIYLLKSDEIEVIRKDIKTGEPVSFHIGPQHPQWIPIKHVSHFFINAVIVAEDSRFYEHIGIDFREIWNSLLTNLEQGRYARGASTITQQLVRLTFLTREKTLLRKIREVLGALLLEKILTKEEILEWYINLIPLGQHYHGVKEASHAYFNTEPEFLNIAQSILLAMIIPAPSVWTPSLIRKSLSEAGQKRFIKIANSLFSEGYITSSQLKLVLASGNFGVPLMVLK